MPTGSIHCQKICCELHEMFEHILLFLLLPAFVFSATDLETTCTGTDRVYSDGSCLVLNKTAVRYSKAKVSCEHYLGYSGHLVFIRNDIVENTLQQLITSNSVSNVYVGYEQTNTTGLRNGSWVYAYTNGSTATASYLPWKTGSPSKNNTYDRTYYTASGVIDTAGEITSSAFVCEYEENLKQTVSDLEEKCAANSRVHVYNNGHCYIARSEYKYYYAAKFSCQDIPGINGHLVHIRNEEQAQMVETMIKASSISYAWTGLEATNTSSTNKSLPDSWSYATPQDTKEIATFLPWIPGNPYNSISASATFYYQIVHGLRNINLNSYTFGFICEYEDTKPMATDLEFKCASLAPSLYRAYRNDSCYVMSNSLYYYNKASLSCKDILGYDGHLIHPRSTDDLIMMSSLSGALNGGYLNIWVGIEQTNLTGSVSKTDGWYYVTPSSDNELATFLPWQTNQPTGGNGSNVLYYSGSSVLDDVSYRYTQLRFICQYEEKSKRDVTPTEIYCQNTTGWYINGSCLIDGFTGIGNKTTVCPSVPSLASHPAHLTSKEKILVAQRLGRRYVENLGQPYSNAVYATGLQQLKACAGNGCAEEPNKSWFYVTPEGYKFPANVYNASFWQPNASQDIYGKLNTGVITDTGFNSADGSATYQFICEYLWIGLRKRISDEPWNFTNFQKMCLKSANPSTSIDNTCFTLNRKTYNITGAETKCNEFAGGHLAQITSTELATYLKSNLWANFGIPNNMALYTNLRQFPQSAADEPDKGYYYVMPDGSKSLAANPPWMTYQPIASGDAGSLNQAGELVAVSGANMQWSICQYDCSVNSAWTAWSACSQSCDKGIRSRKGMMYDTSDNCNITAIATPVYQYESCASGVRCKSSSTKVTTLKSECMGKAGSHFAYSSCYFLANISGSQADANDFCVTQGGQLASLFGEDLVSQLGSLFLQLSSVQAWIGLKVTSGKLKWMVDNAPHTLFKNISTPPTGSECYALVSDSSSPNATENPRLSPMACSSQLQQAICMKSDHIYSSYSIKKGKKVIEAESPESVSIEVDFNACGARCSEIISCVGFNFNPSDGSCIPTKVCPAMPSVIDGATIYTIQDESSWVFYERI